MGIHVLTLLSGVWLLVLYSASWQADVGALIATGLLIGGNFVVGIRDLIVRKRILFTAGLMQIALFGSLHAQIYTALGPEHYRFDGTPHAGHWLEFTAAHVLRAADLLDVLQNYGIELQHISHESTLACAVLVAMHLTVGLFLVTLLVGVLLRWWRRLFAGPASMLLAQKRAFAEKLSERLRVLQRAISYPCLAGFVLCALLQQWRAVDWLLWPLDQVMRIVDVGDVMEIGHTQLHDVPFSLWTATLGIAVRFWIGLYVARWLSAVHAALLGRSALRTLDDFVADLVSPEETTRHEAALALAQLGEASQPAVPALVQSLADESWEVGCAARLALRCVGAATADQVEELVRLLDEPDWAVRRGAVEALGRMGWAARIAVPALVARLADHDPHLPKKIQLALVCIAPDWPRRTDLTAALPKLVSKLEARDPRMRQAAAEALGRCGRAARPAVPSLLERLIDRHEYVRMSIEMALDRIDPEWRDEVYVPLPRPA